MLALTTLTDFCVSYGLGYWISSLSSIHLLFSHSDLIQEVVAQTSYSFTSRLLQTHRCRAIPCLFSIHHLNLASHFNPHSRLGHAIFSLQEEIFSYCPCLPCPGCVPSRILHSFACLCASVYVTLPTVLAVKVILPQATNRSTLCSAWQIPDTTLVLYRLPGEGSNVRITQP